jgi:cytochrome c oxidase subunit 2
MWDLFNWMPPAASEWAPQVDWLHNLITWISVFFTIAITLVMIYFAIRYRRKNDDDETAFITHNVTIETVWTVVPTVIVIWIFGFGYLSYKEARTPPANAQEVYVEGYKWAWQFTYENGKKSTQDLVVPLGEPTRLIMTSRDVIHSFYIPAMRIKEDVYKGNYSYIWFTPNKLGEYHIFCTEYCGAGHSDMLGKLKVVSKEAYQDFLLSRKDADAPQLPPAELGKELFTKNNCKQCHSLDGSNGIGPSLKGVFAAGSREFTDGTKAEVDENYIRESIQYSNKKIVVGYAPMMPAFADTFSEEELNQLIAYLKTL